MIRCNGGVVTKDAKIDKQIKVSGYIQGKLVAIAPLKNNKGIHRS